MVGLLKWNFSEEIMLQMIHSNIIDILRENAESKVEMKELITLLNKKTSIHTIHYIKKYNLISKYIKINYGGVLKFIDTYNIYGLSGKKGRNYVHLLNGTNEIGKRITSDNEWVMVY